MGSAVTKLFIFFAMLGVLPCGAVSAKDAQSSPASYRLRLYHLHTGEHIDVVYRIGDQYLPDRVAELDHFLRDHRTNDVKDYDVKEFDLLHDLLVKLGHPDHEIDIVCGYRTPWSNNYLREHGHGVAEHSQHMEAKAIDIRIPRRFNRRRSATRRCLLDRGGVGYYAQSDFVHVDVAGAPLVALVPLTSPDKAAPSPAPHSATCRDRRCRRRNTPRHFPQPTR